MTARISISDHAVLRWLERVEGVDVKAIRRRILGVAIKAYDFRAPRIKKDGVEFVIDYRADGTAMVTTTFSPVIRAHMSVARIEAAMEPVDGS